MNPNLICSICGKEFMDSLAYIDHIEGCAFDNVVEY